jgi:hypothetical protein
MATRNARRAGMTLGQAAHPPPQDCRINAERVADTVEGKRTASATCIDPMGRLSERSSFVRAAHPAPPLDNVYCLHQHGQHQALLAAQAAGAHRAKVLRGQNDTAQAGLKIKLVRFVAHNGADQWSKPAVALWERQLCAKLCKGCLAAKKHRQIGLGSSRRHNLNLLALADSRRCLYSASRLQAGRSRKFRARPLQFPLPSPSASPQFQRVFQKSRPSGVRGALKTCGNLRYATLAALIV